LATLTVFINDMAEKKKNARNPNEN